MATEQGPAYVPFQAYVEKEKEIEKYRLAATTDQLTGALNRHGLEMYLETAASPKAMLVVDATNFKQVNDLHGYNAGDRVIVDTHQLLRAGVRPNDVIARWGGDEFIVILNDSSEEPSAEDDKRSGGTPPEEIITVTKARIAELVKHFLAGNRQLEDMNFDLAVGGVVWNGEQDLQHLIALAEAQMKEHKATQHASGRYHRQTYI